MTQQWIKGNIPEDKEAYYWITVGTSNVPHTVPQPALYDNELDAWILFDGTKWSRYAVTAYCKIVKPQKMSTVGNGYGYYIKRKCLQRNDETIFGYRLQFANWCMRGYPTVEKAVVAAKRLRKTDITDGYEEAQYEIVDGDGNRVKGI